MVQIVKYMLSKLMALSANPSTTKKKKKQFTSGFASLKLVNQNTFKIAYTFFIVAQNI
jgi:hypothetical protein